MGVATAIVPAGSAMVGSLPLTSVPILLPMSMILIACVPGDACAPPRITFM